MTDRATQDTWAPLAKHFVDDHYGSLRGRVRTHVINERLRNHMGPPPQRVVDVGGGAGNQSVPLARAGRRSERRGRAQGTRERSFRHGPVPRVLMYLDDPKPLIESLCELAAPAGVVSIVAKNVEVMALRHAHEGDWAGAIAAFDSDRQVNGLGVDTRGDRIEGVSALLADRGIEPVAWYGVRLFTDGWTPGRAATDPEDLVLQAELMASERDPNRGLSRLFHLVGRRTA